MERDYDKLRKELIQVAALAVRTVVQIADPKVKK